MNECPSAIHVEPEPATVRGWFHNSDNPISDGPVEFCDSCALTAIDFGFFTPGPQEDDSAELGSECECTVCDFPVMWDERASEWVHSLNYSVYCPNKNASIVEVRYIRRIERGRG